MTKFLLSLLVACLLASCEKMVIETNDGQEAGAGKQNVVVRVADMDTGWDGASSRAQVSISEVCTLLQFAVFKNGTRVKSENQDVNDSSFGTLVLQLEPGTYQLLALGHSGEANVTTTNPLKLQFTNFNPSSGAGTGFTDTFYYYGDIVVGEDGAQADISMQRATSKFRLVTNDVKPANVKTFHFFYTGGSGALNATTGYGCVNSQQVVIVSLDDTQTGQPLTFEMYTFLHAEEGNVTFTVKALDAKSDILYEKEFKDVPMKRNCITQYTGNYFTSGGVDVPDTPVNPDPSQPDGTFSAGTIYVDPEWDGVFEYTF